MSRKESCAKTSDLTLHFNHDMLVVHRRYEVISIINDVLIGLWFLLGSICFFYSSLMMIGTWLFVIGSAQMLIRPVIRLSRHFHLKRLPQASDDF
ncbi:YrhK family protein [Kushneria indalinina]|uniref:YrhK-like protein n=1 Tax=Kushneria indalinina DSM 14324 TaxID=1122140 RepID=A0A3D9E0Q9_9GAMM|nr:YrhK family protein [Kushneria indalinina]REC96054.1 YrhK-like protein [Kushneria indalinina DSM 14324]